MRSEIKQYEQILASARQFAKEDGFAERSLEFVERTDRHVERIMQMMALNMPGEKEKEKP